MFKTLQELTEIKYTKNVGVQEALTDEQKKELIADFKEWSGGFTPQECPWKGDDKEKSVSQFIDHAMSVNFPKDEVVAFLGKLCESVTTKENESRRREQFIERIEAYFGALESIRYDLMTTADLRKMYNALISDNLIKPLKEELMTEGFMDFSVVGSDSAADLHSTALEAVEKRLRAGLKDKGNAYNTHGTLNVAMILIEKFKNDIDEYGGLHDLAVEVMNKLNDEIKAQQKKDKENNRISGDYLAAMQSFAKKLAKATASK